MEEEKDHATTRMLMMNRDRTMTSDHMNTNIGALTIRIGFWGYIIIYL